PLPPRTRVHAGKPATPLPNRFGGRPAPSLPHSAAGGFRQPGDAASAFVRRFYTTLRIDASPFSAHVRKFIQKDAVQARPAISPFRGDLQPDQPVAPPPDQATDFEKRDICEHVRRLQT